MPILTVKGTTLLEHDPGEAGFLPESPSEEDARWILDQLTLVITRRLVLLNQAEIERLRGTPGELIPVCEARLVREIDWKANAVLGGNGYYFKKRDPWTKHHDPRSRH